MRFFFACWILCLLGFWGANASAHSFDSERVIIIDSSRENIEILVTYREAPGRRLDYLMGIYDKNQDGILSERESLFLTPALKKIGLRGLEISALAENEETRIKYKRRDGLSIAILYHLPKSVKTLTIEFKKDEEQLMTKVQFIGNALSFLNGFTPTKANFLVDKGAFGIERN